MSTLANVRASLAGNNICVSAVNDVPPGTTISGVNVIGVQINLGSQTMASSGGSSSEPSVILEPATLKPHPAGPGRYERAMRMAGGFSFSKGEKAKQVMLTSTMTEASISLSNSVEIRFEFTNPLAPDQRASIERGYDGSIVFHGLYFTGLPKNPRVSHREFCSDLRSILHMIWDQQDGEMPSKDLKTVHLYSDVVE